MKPLTQRAMEPTKASFATVHWDQEVESAAAPDGHVRVHQSQAPPFSLGLPSGLARSQQLYMMQRFLNIPATPSYVAKDHGLVLDRVVVNLGGRTWWHTLTLRLRAQRAWNTQEFSKGKPHQVLGDPSMYALGGRFRAGFGRDTVLKAVGELGSLKPWAERFRRLTGRDPNVQNPANVPAAPPLPHEEKPRGRVTLQSKSIPFHLVQFDVSHRERYQTPGGYRDGPSHASASVSARGPQPFNYRFGVRQWLDDTIPAFERTPGSAALRPPPRREFTAGASLEHQATLWRGERRAPPPGRRPGGYAALPQLPCVSVGALVGAVARVPLLDSEGDWKKGRMEGRHVASACLHASFGSFSRPLLDYTAVDLRYDAGAVQPHAPLSDPKRPGEMSAIERAVSFNGKVVMESETVTLAATQQLLGPLRLRAEVRCKPRAAASALASGWSSFKNPLPKANGSAGGSGAQNGAAGGGGRFGSAWHSIKGEMKAAELAYGVDCPLPPALGAARLVAWYNVSRGEAQAEMRLFDL